MWQKKSKFLLIKKTNKSAENKSFKVHVAVNSPWTPYNFDMAATEKEKQNCVRKPEIEVQKVFAFLGTFYIIDTA